MYERMLDKSQSPAPEQVREHMGTDAYGRLEMMEASMRARYQLGKELRFPFGNSYGWGYKYSHKSTHLCYAFFEKGAFTVTLQINDKQAPIVESMLGAMSTKAAGLWKDRYPCGEHGGWIHYRVTCDGDLDDIYQLLSAKKPPLSGA